MTRRQQQSSAPILMWSMPREIELYIESVAALSRTQKKERVAVGGDMIENHPFLFFEWILLFLFNFEAVFISKVFPSSIYGQIYYNESYKITFISKVARQSAIITIYLIKTDFFK